MRISALLVSGLLMAMATACNPEVQFDVPVKGDTTVPAGSVLETVLASFGFGALTTFDLSQSDQFSANDTRKDQVTSTKLTKLTLSITSPSGANFDFLQSLAFKASSDGLADVEVAHKTVPKGSSSFDCDLDGAELAPYVRAPTMTINTDVNGSRPSDDTTVHIEANFHVSAHVLGDH